MNIVLFDGICNLCNTIVSFLIKYDTQHHLHFAAQQNAAGKKIMQQKGIMGEHNTVIFIKDDMVYYKSDAILEIAKLIKGWPRIFKYSCIFPKVLRNGIYDIIAKNRYRIFGKKTTCSQPSEADKDRFL